MCIDCFQELSKDLSLVSNLDRFSFQTLLRLLSALGRIECSEKPKAKDNVCSACFLLLYSFPCLLFESLFRSLAFSHPLLSACLFLSFCSPLHSTRDGRGERRNKDENDREVRADPNRWMEKRKKEELRKMQSTDMKRHYPRSQDGKKEDDKDTDGLQKDAEGAKKKKKKKKKK